MPWICPGFILHNAQMKRAGWSLGLLLLFCFLAWASNPSPKLPDRPSQAYLADFAGVLTAESKSQLQAQLAEWNRKSPPQVYLVTVGHLSSHGQKDMQQATQALAGHWKLDGDDLMLAISVGDKKAWIFSGDQWNAEWRQKASQILQDEVVPACNIGDYKLALSSAALSLHQMAEIGPAGSPVAHEGFGARVEYAIKHHLPYCLLPWPVVLVLFALGVLCIALGALGAVKEGDRMTVVLLGLGIIAGTAISSVLVGLVGVAVLVGILMMLPSHHHHHHCWSFFGWSNSCNSWSDWFCWGDDHCGGSSSWW